MTRIELRQKDINKVGQDVQNALAQNGVRLDSDSSLFLARELTTVSTSVLEKAYTDLDYNKLPQLIESGNGNGTDRTIMLPVYERTGGYTVSDDIAQDTKQVGAKRTEQPVKVKTIQNHAKWNLFDMERAAKNRIALSNEMLMETRNQWEYANEDACFKGLRDEAGNVVSDGLFNYFTTSAGAYQMSEYTGISNSGSGSTKDKYLFANKTAAVIIEEMLGFIRAAYEANKVSMYKATDIMIPLGLMTQLQKQAWSSGSDRNIIEYLEAIERVRFHDIALLNAVSQLVNATTYESAMIAFKADPKFIAHVIARPYQVLAPEVNALFTKVETVGRVVGGVVREPKAVYFAKGVYKNP